MRSCVEKLASGPARSLRERGVLILRALVLIVGSISVLALFSNARAQNSLERTQPLLADTDAFPLKASDNRRYLVDQRNKPFLLVGDAPQTIVTNVSFAEAAAYIANRDEYGINTLWINLLCNFSDGCNNDATTFDGVAPFLAAGDLSRPNPAYFQRADDIIKLAAKYGMVVLLDPIETSSSLPILRAAGLDQAVRYGQYLGRRYKDFPNIIWIHGNDFQSWRSPTDDALVQAVARGIRSEDQVHIHTVELNFTTSGSLDDPSWAPLIELDAAYTYFPTYAEALRPNITAPSSNQSSWWRRTISSNAPMTLYRKAYDDKNTGPCSCGATGQVYGSAYTWRLEKGWETKIEHARSDPTSVHEKSLCQTKVE